MSSVPKVRTLIVLKIRVNKSFFVTRARNSEVSVCARGKARGWTGDVHEKLQMSIKNNFDMNDQSIMLEEDQ